MSCRERPISSVATRPHANYLPFNSCISLIPGDPRVLPREYLPLDSGNLGVRAADDGKDLRISQSHPATGRFTRIRVGRESDRPLVESVRMKRPSPKASSSGKPTTIILRSDGCAAVNESGEDRGRRNGNSTIRSIRAGAAREPHSGIFNSPENGESPREARLERSVNGSRTIARRPASVMGYPIHGRSRIRSYPNRRYPY